MTTYDNSFTGSVQLKPGDERRYTIGGPDDLNNPSIPITDVIEIVGGVLTNSGSSGSALGGSRTAGRRRVFARSPDIWSTVTKTLPTLHGGSTLRLDADLGVALMTGVAHYRNILFCQPGARVFWVVSGVGNFFAGISRPGSLSSETTGESAAGVSLEVHPSRPSMLRVDGAKFDVPFTAEASAVTRLIVSVETISNTQMNIQFHVNERVIASVADWDCCGRWCPTAGVYNSPEAIDMVSMDDGTNGFSYD
jgi:hypothetical protein